MIIESRGNAERTQERREKMGFARADPRSFAQRLACRTGNDRIVRIPGMPDFIAHERIGRTCRFRRRLALQGSGELRESGIGKIDDLAFAQIRR